MVQALIKDKWIQYRLEILVCSIFFIYLLLMRSIIPIFKGRLFGDDPLGYGVSDWDFYVKMSKDIFSIFKKQIIKPFCYRPLVPLIAGLLPFNLEMNYALISFFSIYFTGIMLYFTLRLRFSKELSIFGLVFFCYLNYIPFGKMNLFDHAFFYGGLYNIYNVDMTSWLFTMCCIYCIFSPNKKLFSIFLILGVLTKEIILIIIPVYLINEFMERDKTKDKKEILSLYLKSILFIIPGILTYLIIQVIVIPEPLSNYPMWHDLIYKGNTYGSIEMILVFVKYRINQIINNPFTIYQWTMGIWGISLTSICISFNSLADLINWVKLYGFFLLLVYFQLFVGLSEARYIDYGFFPIIFLGVSGLSNMNDLIKDYKLRH